MNQMLLLQFVTIFIAVVVFSLPLKPPKLFWTRLLLFACGNLVLFYTFLRVANTPVSTLFDIFWFIRPFLYLGILYLCTCFCLQKADKSALYLALWAYLAEECCFDSSQIASSYLNFTGFDAIIRFNAVFDALMLLGLYIFVSRKLPQENRLILTKEQVRSALLLTVLTVIIKPIAIWAKRSDAYNAFMLFQIVCAIIVMAVLFSRAQEEKRLAVEKELSFQRQLWQQRRAQLEISQKNIELLNCKYHDLKHYISAIRNQNNTVEQLPILEEMEASVKVFDNAIRTGNTVLDTILTEKSLLCEQKKVTMTCVADGSLLKKMSAVDLYTMLGNAVDNAVECVTNLSDTERRVISIEIFRVADLVKIQIENFCDDVPAFENGLPVTSKPDREYHGYGLKSIRLTAEKYKGCMSVEANDGLFLLHILFPAEQVAAESTATDYAGKSTD